MLSSYNYSNSYATEPDSRYKPGQTMLAFPLTTLDVSMPQVLQVKWGAMPLVLQCCCACCTR